MTTRAVRFESRATPTGRFRIAFMTIETRQASMTARDIEDRVSVTDRQPALRGMADIALPGGNKVITVFADGNQIIMATVTNTAS